MKTMEFFQQSLNTLWPLVAIIGIGAALAWLINWFVKRSPDAASGLLYPVLNWINVSAIIIALIIMLPISEQTRGQVLSLLGVVLTAVIALSSTTFVSNAMAGVMLQATQSFRPGDYIRVNDQFGRVIKRTLVNTQIQTEWRDLTTLPNLLLINSPVNVLHREGTIIFAEVSIGYDAPYTRVEELMKLAAADAGLEEPFVLVHELLDHAVAYRVCGFLPSIKNLLSSRSNLRKTVLAQMHGNGIEIVSPAFMNQRQMDPERKIIPERPVLHDHLKQDSVSQAPEEKIFDKAVEAESLDELKLNLDTTRGEIKIARNSLKEAAAGNSETLETLIAELEKRENWLTDTIKGREEKA
jgi:small-conductance mechanosensitive channel